MQISKAKKILEEVLTILGINVRRIEVVAGEPHTLLSVSTPDSGLLIGTQGENLRALNYLVKKIVEANTEDAEENQPFLIDVNGYYRRRMAELRQQARILAERARTFKSDVMMEPTNAYERMIVHATFADDLEIYTESSGVGRKRHIVFKYKKPQEAISITDKDLFSQE